ncbi:MAG: hypothetical protein AAFP84_21165, partial [Actinomycetota bacterium]
VGLGEVPISISSHPGDRIAYAYTLRRAGAVTRALADRSVGDVITVRGPFGVPWDLDRATGRHVLFVAGGIGLAPLRSAIEVLASPDGSSPDRTPTTVTVVVGARDPASIIFRPWLDDLRGRGVVVRTIVDAVPDGSSWTGTTGIVTDLLVDAVRDPLHTAAYVCGPDVMMRATIAELGALGVAAGDIEVTLERNMQCGTGWCGHCQLGPLIVCRDGPVVNVERLGDLLDRGEL